MVIGDARAGGETGARQAVADDADGGSALAAESSDGLGAIRVAVSAAGVPVRVHIDEDLPAATDPERLAARVLAQCRAAAARAQAELRADLAAAGADERVLDAAGLPAGAPGGGPHPLADAPAPTSWLVRA